MRQIFLAPLAFLFGCIVWVRNFCFDQGFFKTKKWNKPIISFGNLSMGGTGKTPHVAFFAQGFIAQKKRLCIVSRGYGGQYGGYPTRVQAEIENAALIYGDEPVFYAKNLKIPVYVSHDRSAAVEKCLSEEAPDLILSDDSFQHRWMGRTQDIVLLDSTDYNFSLFPLGHFREPLSSLKRATGVILTKVNLISESEKENWLRLLDSQGFSVQRGNLFLSRYIIECVDMIRGIQPLQFGSSVFLASSIARPETFKQMLQDKFKIVKQYSFTDHHHWSQADVDQIESDAVKEQVKDLIITEKDFVKIDHLIFQYIQVHVTKLQLKIHPEINYEKLI
jgi:tetraacyldisaccharide 4'-kinase